MNTKYTSPCDECELSADVSNCVNCAHMPMHDDEPVASLPSKSESMTIVCDRCQTEFELTAETLTISQVTGNELLLWAHCPNCELWNPVDATIHQPWSNSQHEGDVFADGRSEFTKS